MRSADLGLWFGTNANDGLVIADVATQGPIAKLGFQEGDRIVSVGGVTVANRNSFMQQLSSANAADGRVPVIINRGGKQMTIEMEPQSFLTHVNSYQHDPLDHLGIVADDRVEGKAVVWRVMRWSPAYYAGLRRGDVITQFDNQSVKSADALSQMASDALRADAKAGPLDLEVQRGDHTRKLELEVRDSQNQAHSVSRPNLDADESAPALGSGVRTTPSTGYYNNYSNGGRRGLFRWRR